MTPDLTLPGVLATAVFLALLGAILLWMLRAPRLVPVEVEHARRSVDILKRIFVPTVGAAHSDRGVELACRLGSAQHAKVLLACVIEVPRTLPLSAPLRGLEEQADAALARAEKIVRLHGLEPERLLARARVAGEEIVRMARDSGADLIVMGIRPRVGLREEILGRTSDIVLRGASCEVLLDMAPGASGGVNGGGGQ
jgi:nucleotide-binding universal stress UspA family protein